MALDTYANLQTAIADNLIRDDLTSYIPDWITAAEAKFNRTLRHWRMEKRATVTLTDQYTALPSDFLEFERIHIDGLNRTLRPITAAEMQDKRSQSYTSTEFVYFSITGGEIEMLPAQDSGTLEMAYYAKIPALSDSNTTNWLLDEAPDLYLYGALLHSAPFLDEDQRLVTWGSLHKAILDELNQDSEMAKWGGHNLKMRI